MVEVQQIPVVLGTFLVAIIVLGTTFDVMGGDFRALLPGWVGFAISNQTLFAFIAVIVALLLGSFGAWVLSNI